MFFTTRESAKRVRFQDHKVLSVHESSVLYDNFVTKIQCYLVQKLMVIVGLLLFFCNDRYNFYYCFIDYYSRSSSASCPFEKLTCDRKYCFRRDIHLPRGQ